MATAVMTRRAWAPPTHAASIAPGPSRASRVLSSPGVRTLRVGLESTPADPLLGFCLPRVFPLPADGTDLRRSSLRTLGHRSLPKLPPGPIAARAPRYHSPGSVALPLSRPPSPSKVPRTRLSRPFEQIPVRAFCSPRAPGGVAAPCEPSLDRLTALPEWNEISGSAKL
jgi:hypothetical protein